MCHMTCSGHSGSPVSVWRRGGGFVEVLADQCGLRQQPCRVGQVRGRLVIMVVYLWVILILLNYNQISGSLTHSEREKQPSFISECKSKIITKFSLPKFYFSGTMFTVRNKKTKNLLV